MSRNNLAAIAALNGAAAANLASSTVARAKQKKTHFQHWEKGLFAEDRMNLEFDDEAYIAKRMGELAKKDITEVEAEYHEAEYEEYLLRMERNGLMSSEQFLEQKKKNEKEPVASVLDNVVSAQNSHIYEDPDMLYRRSQSLLICPMSNFTIHIMKVILSEAHRLDVVNATPKWKNMLEGEIIKDMFVALSTEIDRNAGKDMDKKKDWIAFLEEINNNTVHLQSGEKQGKYIKELWNIYGSMVKQGQTDCLDKMLNVYDKTDDAVWKKDCLKELWDIYGSMVKQGQTGFLDKMLNIYNRIDDTVWKKSCLIGLYRLRKSSSRSQNVIIARRIAAACKRLGIEDKHIQALGKVDTLITRPTDSVKNYLVQKERE